MCVKYVSNVSFWYDHPHILGKSCTDTVYWGENAGNINVGGLQSDGCFVKGIRK